MTDHALNAAVTRLERALARAEHAAAVQETADGGRTESYAALAQRHGTLRARVQDTIGQLDALIADAPISATDAR